MQHCPNCGGGALEIIAAILEQPVIEKILEHLGLQAQAQPLPRAAAREAGQLKLAEPHPVVTTHAVSGCQRLKR